MFLFIFSLNTVPCVDALNKLLIKPEEPQGGNFKDTSQVASCQVLSTSCFLLHLVLIFNTVTPSSRRPSPDSGQLATVSPHTLFSTYIYIILITVVSFANPPISY